MKVSDHPYVLEVTCEYLTSDLELEIQTPLLFFRLRVFIFDTIIVYVV